MKERPNQKGEFSSDDEKGVRSREFVQQFQTKIPASDISLDSVSEKKIRIG